MVALRYQENDMSTSRSNEIVRPGDLFKNTLLVITTEARSEKAPTSSDMVNLILEGILSDVTKMAATIK